MQWLALLNRGGEPAMALGEEVLFACHAAHNPAQRCLLLGRVARGRNSAHSPLGPGLFIQSTWDGKPVEDVLVPYAFARPVPPEPRTQ